MGDQRLLPHGQCTRYNHYRTTILGGGHDRHRFEIETLSTAFRDMAKDIDEKLYATPECTSSAKHILKLCSIINKKLVSFHSNLPAYAVLFVA
ncbi:MAG TPA: hypothetical protein VLG72_03200 [Nitrospirota bacterium]|nr:hypothetical protein [Nitrospirota bacterium]